RAPGCPAPGVQDEAFGRDPELLRDGEERVEQTDVLVAIHPSEGFGDVVVRVLLLRVPQDLGFAAITPLGPGRARPDPGPGLRSRARRPVGTRRAQPGRE